MIIVFGDTETTGLTSMDQVIEYSFAIWEDGRTHSPYTRRVMPTVPCNPEAARVNGYNPEEWQASGAVPWSDQDCDYCGYYLSQGIPGGHNTPFDIGMIAREFERARRPFPQLPRDEVDTKRLAVPLMQLQQVQKTGLASVAAFFGINTDQAHTSMGDVIMTIKVWECILSLYRGGLCMAPEQPANPQEIPWPTG